MTNEDQVARLLEKRKEEPEEGEQEPSLEGEYDLEEIESVKLENIALRKERLEIEHVTLVSQQQILFDKIRERLGVTKDYELGFNPQRTRVRVRRLDNDRGKETEQHPSGNEVGA